VSMTVTPPRAGSGSVLPSNMHPAAGAPIMGARPYPISVTAGLPASAGTNQ
jgi:hypothetical protein